MIRFKVINGPKQLSRPSGCREFHLLKGPEAEDHTLYASHTVWKNRATFPVLAEDRAQRSLDNKTDSDPQRTPPNRAALCRLRN
jgi:heme-degrading monooxygenase HmoA